MVDNSKRDPTKLEVFTYPTRLFGATNGYFLDDKSLQIAANYVLFNMPEVTPYRLDFEVEMRSQDPQISLDEMNTLLDTQFKAWMLNKVRQDRDTYKRFKNLLKGPSPYVTTYRGCDVNGYRFKCTKTHSGVLVKGSCYDDTISNYYGRLKEILVLLYNEEDQVVLFKCYWFDNRRGIKVDKNQIVTIDMTSKLRGNDVFVLASQATQVYYAPIVKNLRSKMHTVITTRSRPLDETTYTYNEDTLQEEPLESRPIELPPINIFVDLTQYENRMIKESYQEEPDNDVESEEQEESEEDGDEDDGYDNIE